MGRGNCCINHKCCFILSIDNQYSRCAEYYRPSVNNILLLSFCYCWYHCCPQIIFILSTRTYENKVFLPFSYNVSYSITYRLLSLIPMSSRKWLNLFLWLIPRVISLNLNFSIFLGILAFSHPLLGRDVSRFTISSSNSVKQSCASYTGVLISP